MFGGKHEKESNKRLMESSLQYLKEAGDLLIASSIQAFYFTYENDGRDVSNGTETTADGSYRRPSGRSFFHSLITFIGLPSRIGDEGFTWLQFGRDFIGGWSPFPRTREGKLDWGNFNSKNWLNIIGTILLIKPILIPAIKIATWPLKWARNFLKIGTEHIPLTLEDFFLVFSDHYYESFTDTWEKVQSYNDRRNPIVYDGIKTVNLIFIGALFLVSYLSSWAFSIIHAVGMAITSPDKSRRYWNNVGVRYSSDSFLKYIPFSSYVLPVILQIFSVTVSALTWAIIFPLGISALTTMFPALIPTVTSLANLPFIAASLKMISATVISVSTTIAGIFAPAIAVLNAFATAVGIQVTTTSFAVGFTLGALAAPFAVAFTYIADKASNLWATFKGTDRYEPLARVKELASSTEQYNIGIASTLVRELFETHMPEYESEICKVVVNYCYGNIINWESNVRNKNAQDFIGQIDEKRKTANQEIVKRRLALFKQHLEEKYRDEKKHWVNIPENEKLNWKDLLYGAKHIKLVSSHTKMDPSVKLEVNFSAESQIDAITRQKELTITASERGRAPDVAATTGTTFFTNSQAVLARSEKVEADPNLSVTHVMDSCIAAHIKDSYDSSRSYLAMADGLGGHTGDKAEDTRISRASYFGCKHAIRLCSQYIDADSLKVNLGTIMQEVGQEILRKNNGSRESTSLTCATVFQSTEYAPQRNRNYTSVTTLRVIGANIGDSMLVAWNPRTQTVTTLLPGRHLVQNIGTGPAQLPANFDLNSDLDIVDATLDEDTVLIPFTDGMLGEFNTATRQETKNGKDYKVFAIDPKWMLPILQALKPNASSKEIVAALMENIMTHAETDRIRLNAQANIATAEVERTTETQKVMREQIRFQKSLLSGTIQSFWEQKERNEITEAEFLQKRAPLTQQLAALDSQSKALSEQLSSIEAQTQIKYGDDIAVMAVRF